MSNGSAVLALALGLALWPGSAGADTPGSYRAETSAGLAGAQAAQGEVLLRIRLTRINNRLRVFPRDDRRLAFSSPQGVRVPILPDGTPDPECTLHSPTLMSCAPGHVAAVVGNMGGGRDRFVAARRVRVLFGAVVRGRLTPWSGGPGGDRLTSGRGADALDGGPGHDLLAGRGSPDLLRGGKGRDRLLGALGRDVLLGGPGRDRLNGGAGRDFCHGGPGRDRGRRCALTRGIP
jgi:hypothetical protein